MSIRVLQPGVSTTVQDLGRPGYQRLGVSVGGAMDRLSLRIANCLVGNDEEMAALEATVSGPTLQFERDAVIALCGGSWSPRAGDALVPMNRPVWLAAGSVLRLGSVLSGARAYLAVAGGISVPKVMGSRSTSLPARFGGLLGRVLQAADQLTCGEWSPRNQRCADKLCGYGKQSAVLSGPWFAGLAVAESPSSLRVLRGAEFELLSPEGQDEIFSLSWKLTSQCDRMGYRLAGPALALRAPVEMISAAVCPGTIQLPPDGQPVLLMADCATTGGYPKIAHLATVDLPAAGQLKPGDSIRLDEISLTEAHNLYRRQELDLQCLQTSLKLKFAD